MSWLFAIESSGSWSRPTEACHQVQQGGERGLLGSLLTLSVGLCASPPWSPGTLDSPLKRIQSLKLPAGKPWSPVVENSSQPASQAGIFRFCLEDTETFIHFSFFVWSHCNPRHVIEMGYNCGLLHPPIWESRKELPAVRHRAWRAFSGKGKSKWIFENNNMLIKKRKKVCWGEGAPYWGCYGEEGYLLFGNLVLVLFCKLQNSSLEELMSHIWGWEIKMLGIIWVRSMAVINMRLSEE